MAFFLLFISLVFYFSIGIAKQAHISQLSWWTLDAVWRCWVCDRWVGLGLGRAGIAWFALYIWMVHFQFVKCSKICDWLRSVPIVSGSFIGRPTHGSMMRGLYYYFCRGGKRSGGIRLPLEGCTTSVRYICCFVRWLKWSDFHSRTRRFLVYHWFPHPLHD